MPMNITDLIRMQNQGQSPNRMGRAAQNILGGSASAGSPTMPGIQQQAVPGSQQTFYGQPGQSIEEANRAAQQQMAASRVPQYQNPAGMVGQALGAAPGQGPNVADIIRRQQQTAAFNPALGAGGPGPSMPPQAAGAQLGAPSMYQNPAGMLGQAMGAAPGQGPNVADIIRRQQQTAAFNPALQRPPANQLLGASGNVTGSPAGVPSRPYVGSSGKAPR